MEELKYSKLDEMNITKNPEKVLMYKPKLAPIVCFIMGVALMFVNDWLARILGLFFVAMAVLVLKFVDEKKILSIFDDGVLIYHNEDKTLGFFLKYDDVKQWEITHENGKEGVIFTLSDDNRLPVFSFQMSQAFNTLDKYMHDKEKRVIERKRIKKLKFNNPVEVFRNWFNKKK